MAGRVTLDLPPRMDGDQPAQDRLDPGVHETRAADHRFEFRHGRKAADRFDQVAIAFRIASNGRADLGHQMVRIGVVDFLEAGPFGGREFEAEKPSAVLQHAVGFGQGLVDVGDVADAEGDRIGIEEPVGEAQFLGVLARPDKTVEALVHRAFDAHVEHVLVDVRDSDAGAVGGANVLHYTAKDYPDAGRNAVNNGLDVLFQTAQEHYKLFIPPFLNGQINQARLDDAVNRVLRAKFELGLFETPYLDIKETEAAKISLADCVSETLAKLAAV